MRIANFLISLLLIWLGCSTPLIKVSPIISDTVFVFLDFDGYDIDTSLLQVLGAEYEEGDIIHISPSSFSGYKERIRELMSQNFVRVDRTFVFTFNQDEPVDFTVVFGGKNDAFMGLAWMEVAIVFTENPSECVTIDEKIQLTASVGSHELGHLIGFQHTDNPDDIMSTGDIVGWYRLCKNLRQFIEPQPIYLPFDDSRPKNPDWVCFSE